MRATPYNNRVERIARGQHGLCSVGLSWVGLTANPALVPYGLVPPGQRPPAVLTAHSSVIRPDEMRPRVTLGSTLRRDPTGVPPPSREEALVQPSKTRI